MKRSIYIKEDLLKIAKAQAEKEDRSVSKIVCRALKMYIKKQEENNKQGDFKA